MKTPLRHASAFARTSVRVALFLLATISVLEPFALAAARPTRLRPRPAPAAIATQDKDSQGEPTSGVLAQLDPVRRATLDQLVRQLQAGEPFSAQETDVLNVYRTGGELTVLEADVVISRALYKYYIKVDDLSRDQRKLFDAYEEFLGGAVNVADPKHRDSVFRERNPARSIEVAPPNDNCSGAEVVPAAGPFPYLTSVVDITDATQTGDPAAIPSCTFGGGPVSRSVWYTFTPAATANYTISACPAAPTATTIQDTVMGIYTSSGGCAGPFTEIPTGAGSDGCDDDTCAAPLQSVIVTNLTAGTQYFILVHLFGSAAPAVGQSNLQLRFSVNTPAVNDLCSGALPLTLGVPAIGSINTLTNNDYTLNIGAPTCFTGLAQTGNTAVGRDVVYSFVPPATGNYSFIYNSLSAANSPNAIIYLSAPSTSCPAPGALSCIATNVASGTISDASNRITTTNLGSEAIGCEMLTAGLTYYVFVDALALATGTFSFSLEARLCVSETEPNNTPATANAPQCGIQGAMNAASDIDYYSLGTPVAGSKVFAMVDGASASTADFRLRVTNATDTIEFDDDDMTIRWGSLAPTIAGRTLAAVPSFLSVNHFTAATITEPYRLYYAIQPPGAGVAGSSATAEVEPNDTFVTPTIAQNNYFSGAITATTDLDLYRFTATAGDVVFISLDTDPGRDGIGNFDAGLFLFDPTDTQLFGVSDPNVTTNNTTGAGNLLSTTPASPAEGAVITIPVSGTYTVGVNRQSGAAAGSTLDYLLSITKGCSIPTPNVAISKSGPASVPCDSQITYTLTASNVGDLNAINASVTDDLPDCLTSVNVSATSGSFSVGAGNVVTGTIPTLSPGAPVTITITAIVPSGCGASISNQASIAAAGDTTPGNNTSASVTTTIVPVSSCLLSPATDSNPILTSHTVTATVALCGVPQAGQAVNFAVTGRNTVSGSGTSNGSGQVSFTYTDVGPNFMGGTDTITSTVVASGSTCTAMKTWVAATCVPTCPANITQPNDPNQCGRVVTYPAPTSTGDCGTITCVPASGSFFPVGTTTVTCTSQATTSCSFTVTVQDTQAPAITCPANMTVPKTAGQCSAAVSFTVPTPTDNCPGATASCVPASGSTFPVGVTTVTCTATDTSPDSPDTTCTFTITVTDTTAPGITCPANVTQSAAAGQCSAVVSFAAPTTTDNCPGTTVVCVPASGSTFGLGATTVNCTATDASNNTSTCAFTVTITDTQVPVITCPANVSVSNTTGQCSAAVSFTATATDNCPGTTVVCVPASGSTFPVGTTTVNCTATDGSANTATCAFSVTVLDTQAPSITCPANIVQTSTTTAGCGFTQVVTYPAPTVTDNCAVGTVTCVPPSGSTFMEGTTTVTCTATDMSPNSPDAMCTFTVTIGAPFGFCAVDDATGDTFQIDINPMSASYGAWRYTLANGSESYCGRANSVNYLPLVRLLAHDNDYSAENTQFFMSAAFKGNSGTVSVRNKRGNINKTLRDRNLADSACP